jgi:hypothetical protein
MLFQSMSLLTQPDGSRAAKAPQKPHESEILCNSDTSRDPRTCVVVCTTIILFKNIFSRSAYHNNMSLTVHQEDDSHQTFNMELRDGLVK